MKCKVVLQESEEGFSVSCPGLPGCWSQGSTENEAIENICDAIREYLAAIAEPVNGADVREVEVSAQPAILPYLAEAIAQRGGDGLCWEASLGAWGMASRAMKTVARRS